MVLGCTTRSAYALADEARWPRLTGAQKPECVQALQLASRLFDSRTYYLYHPGAVPDGFPSASLVQRDAPYPNDGGLHSDPGYFDTLEQEESERSVLIWQKRPQNGYRIAIFAKEIGWRGSMFDLYSVDASSSAPATFEQFNKEQISAGARKVIANAWVPPQVYRLRDSGALWVLASGTSWAALDNWHVFGPGPESLQRLCSINFRPEKRVVDLLPPAVRKLEALLDASMGSGRDEGTLHPTGRGRNEVQYAWANVALRPWVEWPERLPYNSRAEVDAGLIEWSARSPSHRAKSGAIQRQMRRAEKALAQYYQARFHVSMTQANRQAAYLTDLVYRSHYVFPRTDKRDAERVNPWPLP